MPVFDREFIEEGMKLFKKGLNNQRLQSLRVLCIHHLRKCTNPLCEGEIVDILERLNEIEAELGGVKH